MAWSLMFVGRPGRLADVVGRAAAAAAAADQADLDRVAAGRVDVRERAKAGRGRGGDGRGLEEVAPRRGGCVRRGWLGHGGILRNGDVDRWITRGARLRVGIEWRTTGRA